MDSKKLGLRIKEQREYSHISQKELGAKIGICESSISYYENGTKTPSIENLIKLATALETTPNELLRDYINLNDEDDLYYYKYLIDFLGDLKFMNIKELSKIISVLKNIK